jgi:hypothetical protein
LSDLGETFDDKEGAVSDWTDEDGFRLVLESAKVREIDSVVRAREGRLIVFGKGEQG